MNMNQQELILTRKRGYDLALEFLSEALGRTPNDTEIEILKLGFRIGGETQADIDQQNFTAMESFSLLAASN